MHQCTPFHIQVDERIADLQPIEVLEKARLADFAKAEDAFENAKRMLHISANALLGVILRNLEIAER